MTLKLFFENGLNFSVHFALLLWKFSILLIILILNLCGLILHSNIWLLILGLVPCRNYQELFCGNKFLGHEKLKCRQK